MGTTTPCSRDVEEETPQQKDIYDQGPVQVADGQIPLSTSHIAQALLLSSFGVSAPVLGWEGRTT